MKRIIFTITTLASLSVFAFDGGGGGHWPLSTGDKIPMSQTQEATEAMNKYLITSGGGSVDPGVVSASANLSDVASKIIFDNFSSYVGETREIRGVFKCTVGGVCELELLGSSK